MRGASWLWLVMAIATGVVAWYVYRRTVPPVAERWRRFLFAARLLAIGALLVAMVGPTLEWRGISRRKPRVTVLVDQSESLSFTDPEGKRPDVVRRVLDGPGMDRIRAEATVTWQGFAETVSALDPNRLSFVGNASAIGNALLEQRRRLPPPDEVILISDGANNTGPDPVRVAEDIKLPVYVIGVGDSNPQTDVRVVGVSAPSLAIAGRPMTVTATVENVGFGRRPATLRIVSGGRTLAERIITLPPSGRRADVEVTVTPHSPGVMRSVVALDSIPGELLAQNNVWPFTTRILKSKRRVLILAGAPSADIAFWMRRFRSRKDLDVRLWLAPHPPETSYPPPALLDSLDTVDLVLWHDMPPRALPADRIAAVMGAVRDGGGLLVIPGRNGLPRSWSEMLPVEIGRGRYLDQRTQAVLTSNAGRYPVFSADADFPTWSLAWSTLPPLLGRVVGLSAKRTGRVVLLGEGDPLAVAGTYGKGRVFVFGGLTYWRWDMVPRGLGEPDPAGDAFWSAVVRWLSTRKELSRVRVGTDSPVYRLGEPVRITTQVYDERYLPLDGADVRIDIDNGSFALNPVMQGEGRYTANFAGVGPGDHTVRATATMDGVGLGSASAEFSVTVVGLEHEQTRQQREVLEAVARAGNGGYAPASKADSLLAAISLPEKAEARARTVRIGASGWVLWTIIGLLTLEWVGRRVFGLL